MALCGCCAPGSGRQLGWSAAAAVLGGGVGGVAVWLLTSSSDTETNVRCLYDGLNGMKNLADNPPACSPDCTNDAICECTDWSFASTAMNAFPSVITDTVGTVLDFWTIIVLAPGAAYGGVVLLVALFAALAALTSYPQLFGTASKSLNGIALGTLVWASLAVFLVSGAIGYGRQVGFVDSLYNSSIVTPCNEQVSSINEMVSSSQTNYNNMGCAAPAPAMQALCTEAQTSIFHAANITDEFTGLCTCVQVLLVDAEPLFLPGAVGLGLTLALVVALWGVCATMGCCSSYKPQASQSERLRDVEVEVEVDALLPTLSMSL